MLHVKSADINTGIVFVITDSQRVLSRNIQGLEQRRVAVQNIIPARRSTFLLNRRNWLNLDSVLRVNYCLFNASIPQYLLPDTIDADYYLHFVQWPASYK